MDHKSESQVLVTHCQQMYKDALVDFWFQGGLLEERYVALIIDCTGIPCKDRQKTKGLEHPHITETLAT